MGVFPAPGRHRSDSAVSRACSPGSNSPPSLASPVGLNDVSSSNSSAGGGASLRREVCGADSRMPRLLPSPRRGRSPEPPPSAPPVAPPGPPLSAPPEPRLPLRRPPVRPAPPAQRDGGACQVRMLSTAAWRRAAPRGMAFLPISFLQPPPSHAHKPVHGAPAEAGPAGRPLERQQLWVPAQQPRERERPLPNPRTTHPAQRPPGTFGQHGLESAQAVHARAVMQIGSGSPLPGLLQLPPPARPCPSQPQSHRRDHADDLQNLRRQGANDACLSNPSGTAA